MVITCGGLDTVVSTYGAHGPLAGQHKLEHTSRVISPLSFHRRRASRHKSLRHYKLIDKRSSGTEPVTATRDVRSKNRRGAQAILERRGRTQGGARGSSLDLPLDGRVVRYTT